MSELLIKGGHVITPIEERMTDVTVENGRITSIGPVSSKAADVDASGCYVTPGLFDLQVNGGTQCDFWGDPDEKQVFDFAESLARVGVTAILPTLITDDIEHLRKNIEFLEKRVGVGVSSLEPAAVSGKSRSASGSTAAAALKERRLPVRMPGIHLEGPCLSPEKPGVHPKQHIAPLSLAVLERIIVEPVKLITLAPEKDPSGKTLEFLKQRGVVISLGHSNATLDEAQQAFNRGVTMMTHTFNALPPIHHREPGAVTAALLDERIFCCIICDGLHVSPAAAKLVFRSKGTARSILVTDIAHIGTSQGKLVGSSITLDMAVRNAVKWGALTFQQAIQAATYNPARAMGMDHAIGHIAPGKLADLVIWDKQTLEIKHVITGGDLLF
ncbi:MAG TPA: amidohydrolase family protein [Candidatus Obscuribacterales bacterium]